MKQSASSVPADHRKQIPVVTSLKVRVRKVKFSKEDMIYEPPDDVGDPSKYRSVGRGPNAWRAFLNYKSGFVKIPLSLRKVFKTKESIVEALEQMAQQRSTQPKKSARRKNLVSGR
jgi:hypothetical protein